jgi:hypothetical protein
MKVNFEIKNKMPRDECFFFSGVYLATAICLSVGFIMFLELIAVLWPEGHLVEKIASDLIWTWAVAYVVFSGLGLSFLFLGRRRTATV